jgi:primosomal protein N' (replication factor Y)
VPTYCDVALPVPLESTFTYRLDGRQAVVGGRVLVPFREQRLTGIVTAVHDRAPSMAARKVLGVLDAAPVLDPALMQLGEWIAQYYLAPLGEVFRTMLPLAAEFRRARGYRITDKGIAASSNLLAAPDDADTEQQVLEYLRERDVVREATLCSATGATREILKALLGRKWIAREDLSDTRDAARTVRVAVLKQDEVPHVAKSAPHVGHRQDHRREHRRELTAGQRAIVEALAASGGRMSVDQLRSLDLSRSSLGTLVRRGLVEIVEEPAGFSISGLKPRLALALDDFTSAQRRGFDHILDAVRARQFSVSLIQGVTGSGKTAVYLAAMQAVLAEGRSAILLVPEIGLTPAMAADLHQTFGAEVAILHSGLSDDERAEQWRRIHRGEARMVVGTRSAVFAPVADLALIVVDEEQDHSYKQEETPRYHARDVAVMRAKMAGAAVVLGSATPSLESYHNAQTGKYALIELPDRVEQRAMPEVEIVDMRAEFHETKKEQVLSRKLVAEIAERQGRGEQAMVLLNRRGYSAFVLCRTCGEAVQCRNCAIALTFHKRARRLECHYCGYAQPVPQRCPKCSSDYIYFLGTGSEKLEELLHAQFPQARIARLDRDTVRGRHDFERVLGGLHAGELDIVTGTQMIAKGHDVHGVTLVGVVGADLALSLPDFRAAERTFQLLTQVAGRAGRGETPGKVILQTHFPEHYAVQFAAAHDYRGFYEKEIQFRAAMRYPPFSALANVLIRSDKLEEALKYAGTLGQWFQQTKLEGVRAMGPAAAPIVRLKRDYRYHFILKSASRGQLNAALRAMLSYAAARKVPRTSVIVDVDALTLI